MNLWITSDEHHGHSNILKYYNRLEFMNSKEIATIKSGNIENIRKLKICEESTLKMSSEIIQRHNSRVEKNDTVIHNGDYFFYSANNKGNGLRIKSEYYTEQLNGHHIFIQGHHDRKNNLKTHIRSLVLNIGGMNINVVHNPLHANPGYPINLTAHVHNLWSLMSFNDYYKNKKKELTKKLPQKYLKTIQMYVDKWKEVEKESILINVGVDVRNFKPMSFDEIFTIYYRWKKGKLK